MIFIKTFTIRKIKDQIICISHSILIHTEIKNGNNQSKTIITLILFSIKSDNKKAIKIEKTNINSIYCSNEKKHLFFLQSFLTDHTLPPKKNSHSFFFQRNSLLISKVVLVPMITRELQKLSI